MQRAHHDGAVDRRLARGDLVQTFFDTGRGLQVLYGEVVAAGPVMIAVRWESGIVNRLRRDSALDRDVKRAEDVPEAREAIAASRS